MIKNIFSIFLNYKKRRKEEKFFQKRRKLIISRYNDILKKRNETDFLKEWSMVNCEFDIDLIKNISQIMEWSTFYIFPQDRVSIVLLNNSSDMREVETLLFIEEKTGRQINLDNFPVKMYEFFNNKADHQTH